jgi:hypothetical protein
MRYFRQQVTNSAGVGLGALVLLSSEFQRPGEQSVSSRLWTSEHFIYESRPNDPAVCEGILTTLERHRAAITSFLGIPGPPTRIRYSKFRGLADLRYAGHCSVNSAACFFASLGIETQERFERHELIHAYLAYLGDSHKLLEEGVAEALSCGVKLPMFEDMDWQRAFSQQVWQASSVVERRHLYQAGSWFVGHLLRTWPRERFIELYTRVRPGTDPAGVAATFEEVYGEPLPDVWKRALSSRDPTAACVYAYECATADLAANTPSRWGEACDAGDQFRTLDSTAGTLVVERAQNVGAHVRACLGTSPPPFAERIDPLAGALSGSAFVYALGPGRYAYAASETDSRVQVLAPEHRIESGDRCAQLQSIKTEGAREILFATAGGWQEAHRSEPPANDPAQVRAHEGWSWVASWEDPALAPQKLHFIECGLGVTLQVCSSCNPDSCRPTCDTNVRGKAVQLPVGHAWFRWSAAEDAWFSARRLTR